jgi:hypothetical protein
MPRVFLTRGAPQRFAVVTDTFSHSANLQHGNAKAPEDNRAAARFLPRVVFALRASCFLNARVSHTHFENLQHGNALSLGDNHAAMATIVACRDATITTRRVS